MSGYAEQQLRKTIDIENVALIPKPLSVVHLAEAACNGSAHLIARVRPR
jgi:two-component system cell cycle sensor histidine kinase/response regulator CckA